MITQSRVTIVEIPIRRMEYPLVLVCVPSKLVVGETGLEPTDWK